MKEKHILSLVLGDWSGDGHNIKDTVVISSTLDSHAFREAQRKGFEIVFGDENYEICDEYEQRTLSPEELEKLRKHFSEEKFQEFGLDSDDGLWTDTYTDLILEIVKLGNREFEYEILEGYEIHIGGYGLFG